MKTKIDTMTIIATSSLEELTAISKMARWGWNLVESKRKNAPFFRTHIEIKFDRAIELNDDEEHNSVYVGIDRESLKYIKPSILYKRRLTSLASSVKNLESQGWKTNGRVYRKMGVGGNGYYFIVQPLVRKKQN